MKLALYSCDDGPRRIGVIVDDCIVNVLGAAPEAPHDMIELIKGGPETIETLSRAPPQAEPIALASVRLHAPLVPPEFIAVGLNYYAHAQEADLPVPAAPMIINKQTSCIGGPYDEVILPRQSAQLDYEGELGFVIGRAGRYLSREQASDAIFGYVVVNDLSVRDWQFSSPTVTLGKSFDTHGPFGPWIVTADELKDPQGLELTTCVNGETRQRSSTADMIFDCREIVRFLSQVMTLQPGTLVTTGTPAGVGLFHPGGFLRAGDRVSVEISGIGRIENKVVAEHRGCKL